jgi:hypothetical protein
MEVFILVVLRYSYGVTDFSDGYGLEVFDADGRLHFTTDISQHNFELHSKDRKAFEKWMEDMFDDVFDSLREKS